MSDIAAEKNATLPCPFCGGQPEFENTDERARLRCPGCGTEGGLFFYSQEECESGIGDGTDARAIEAWNRRAAAPEAAPSSPAVPDEALEKEIIVMPLGDKHSLEVWGASIQTRLDAYKAGGADMMRAVLKKLKEWREREVRSIPPEGAAEPVAQLRIYLDTHDMGQSLAPNPPFKTHRISVIDWKRAEALPLGEYSLYLAPSGTTASSPQEVMQQALDALEMAHEGLKWYRDRCPGEVDGSDDEADDEITDAIAALTDALSASSPATGSGREGVNSDGGRRE